MKTQMMKIGKLMLIASMLLLAEGISAQVLRTGYFLDGSLQRYRINPALGAERGFVALPVVGGMNISTFGDVGYGNFVFGQDNGRDLLFTDYRVSADEFLSGLKNENKVRFDMDMSILSFGFKSWGGFNTFDVSLRSNLGLNIPKEMFRAVKTATGGAQFNSIDELVNNIGSYNITDMNIYTRNYVDVSLGHSRNINKNLSIGVRAKLLLGLAYANLDFSQIRMDVNRDNIKYEQKANGDRKAYQSQSSFFHFKNPSIKDISVSNIGTQRTRIMILAANSTFAAITETPLSRQTSAVVCARIPIPMDFRITVE